MKHTIDLYPLSPDWQPYRTCNDLIPCLDIVSNIHSNFRDGRLPRNGNIQGIGTVVWKSAILTESM